MRLKVRCWRWPSTSAPASWVERNRMSESLPVSAGRSGSVPLSSLRLDPENPRIPETHRTKDTAELATLLEMGFEAYPVAQSIAELGFFNAEPLIVIPSPDEADTWIVVEGNRRLTAL